MGPPGPRRGPGAGIGFARALRDLPRVLATEPLPLGGAVLALPGGASAVRTLDGAGTTLTEVPVAPMASVPFGDYGTGPQR